MTTTGHESLSTGRDVTRQTQQALQALADERECLTAERTAFSRFHKQIAAMGMDIDVHTLATPQKEATTGSVITKTSEEPTHSSRLSHVRAAYRDTVMSVPHYEDDYDQALDEHLAEEFSPELASAITTADTFTPPLKEALLAGCHRAIESRQALFGALEQEADSLHQAYDTLEEIETALDEMNQRPIPAWSIEELTTDYERLRNFERQCEELAAERQAQLHSQRVRGPKQADEDFNEYLYESLSVTYPVLADTAACSSLLRTAQRRLEQALVDQ